MSALAKIMVSKGAIVYGSDRNNDAGLFPELFQNLKNNKINLCAQDGLGLEKDIDYLVVSSAIEPTIPDVKAAQKKNIPILKRAELLAEICNAANTITVGGTNGKSTITGMIGHVLTQAGLKPTIINGGGMIDFNRENAVIGNPDRLVVETDESDGTIALYHSAIAVLMNISEDHKSMEELLPLFNQYLSQSKTQVLNIDCPNVAKIANNFPNAVTFSANDIPDNLELIVPGMHNRLNAMATMAVARICHVDDSKILQALSTFKGITSRLEVVGVKNGITVIDDFGHNPDKIEAGIKTLKETGKRLILMYQPHGFKPTRDQKDDLIRVFSEFLDKDDIFYMPKILYMGGTVEKDISSTDIINPLVEKGFNAVYISNISDIQNEIIRLAKAGDNICIMGARDDSLRIMTRAILKEL